MQSRRAFLEAALLLLTFPGCHKRALRDSVVQSSFIFQGTVKQTRSSDVPAILAPGRDTVVVVVDKVFNDQRAFGAFQGQPVTVKITGRSGVKPGKVRAQDTLVFLTNPLVYAQTLAVEGEARRDLDVVVPAVQQRDDLLLQERIDGAELIVSGTVESVAETTEQPGAAVQENEEREHDPEWRTARVHIENVEKGGYRDTYLMLAFPDSTDIVWFKSPKFPKGTTGVWLLRREKLRGFPAEIYSALDPLDFESGPQGRERVRKLAKTAGRKPARTRKTGRPNEPR